MNNIQGISLEYKKTTARIQNKSNLVINVSEKIGQLIARRMKEMGISNAELARRTSLSRGYIGNIVNETAPTQSGQYNLSPSTVEKLSNTLQIPKTALLEAMNYLSPANIIRHEILKGVFVEFDEAVPQKIREQLLEGFKTVAYGVRARTADIEPNVRVYEGNDIKYIDPTGLPKVNEHERPDRLKKTG